MSNMATGIPVGLAIGIGAGFASGKKQARDEIEKNVREFLLNHTITIKDQNGQSLSIDEFIITILKEAGMGKKVKLGIIIGVSVLVLGLAAFLLFYLKNQ